MIDFKYQAGHTVRHPKKESRTMAKHFNNRSHAVMVVNENRIHLLTRRGRIRHSVIMPLSTSLTSGVHHADTDGIDPDGYEDINTVVRTHGVFRRFVGCAELHCESCVDFYHEF